MTFKNRYTPFPKENLLKIILPLTNLFDYRYMVKETIINKEHGSSFDKWIETGGLPLENTEDIEYLKAISLPKIHKHFMYPKNNSLTLSIELQPHEVRLIELEPF